MSSYTPNVNLALTPETTNETFKEWRTKMNGETNSNMTKIDAKFGEVKVELAALKSFQNKIYGVSFSGSSSNGTRLEDAAGLTAAVGIDDEVVTNDFDSIYPWSDIRRCNGYYNENADFVVTAYEGEPEYNTNGSNGNVWVEIPQFWVKEVIVNGDTPTEEKYITPYESEGFRLPEKFIKLDGTHRAKAYIAAYESGKINNVPVSYSGVDVSSPLWSHNSFITACRTLGDNYCAYTMEDFELISFLFQVEFATRHTQGIMQGVVNMNTAAANIAEATASANYVLISNTITTFAAGRPIKLHTSANSAAGDYHIVSNVVAYYAPAEETYDSTKTYYTRTGDAEPYTYEAYTYDETTWAENYTNVFYSTDMKKVILEDDASVTTTTSTKIYCCPFKSGYADNVVASSGSYKANNGFFPFKYRGIENPWGNTWTIMSGILINEYRPYFLKDASNVPVNSSATSIVNSMTSLGYTIPNSNSYAKTMGYDENYPTYRITSEVGGSSSTYYRDYFYQNSGVRAVCSGGDCRYGGAAGLFFFACYYAPSYAYWAISSRLSYTG